MKPMSVKNPPIRPARLFILLAREASVGVILRRGPKDWVQMIKWHTGTDTFEEGQWLRGGIEEYSGDLSPDGRLLFYRFSNTRLSYALEMQKLTTDKLLFYDAISKPPYFTVLALWQYLDGPGGKFIDNSTISFYSFSGWHATRTVPQLNIEIELLERQSEGGLPHEKDVFLTNQGWETIQKGNQYRYENFNPPYIWRKLSPVFTLYINYAGHVFDHQPGGYRNKLIYSLSIDDGKTQTVLENVNWADFDQQGRLVLARQGRLFAGTLENGELKLTELADFNANKPDPQPSPDWAQKW